MLPYSASLAAAVQWLETWRITGNARHLETALTCARITREISRKGSKRKTPAEASSVTPVEDNTDTDSILDEITRTIAECSTIAPEGAETQEPLRSRLFDEDDNPHDEAK